MIKIEIIVLSVLLLIGIGLITYIIVSKSSSSSPKPPGPTKPPGPPGPPGPKPIAPLAPPKNPPSPTNPPKAKGIPDNKAYFYPTDATTVGTTTIPANGFFLLCMIIQPRTFDWTTGYPLGLGAYDNYDYWAGVNYFFFFKDEWIEPFTNQAYAYIDDLVSKNLLDKDTIDLWSGKDGGYTYEQLSKTDPKTGPTIDKLSQTWFQFYASKGLDVTTMFHLQIYLLGFLFTFIQTHPPNGPANPEDQTKYFEGFIPLNQDAIKNYYSSEYVCWVHPLGTSISTSFSNFLLFLLNSDIGKTFLKKYNIITAIQIETIWSYQSSKTYEGQIDAIIDFEYLMNNIPGQYFFNCKDICPGACY